MKKSLALLAGATFLFLGVPSVTHAQTTAASGPFADVPADHWAYQAVDQLQKAGIVIGYPDGTYGGKRAMTRYEFAVAIARLLDMINKIDTSDLATKGDLDALRTDLENKLAANQGAIDELRKLVNEFQGELQALGQNIAAINRRLDNLEARVSAVEEEQRRVKINGALNIVGRADAALHQDGSGAYMPFVDKNGNFVAQRATSKRLLQNSDIYQDFLLGIRGKLSDTATANVKVDFGNFLSNLSDVNYVGVAGQAGSLTPGNQQTTLWEAYLDAPIGLGPLGGAELVAGRFPNQFTKYTLMEPDADVYTDLYQTDSGNIETDGGKVALKIGPAAVQAWAGKFSAIPFSQPFGGSVKTGFNPQPRPTGFIFENHATALQQGAGARVTFGKPESAVLGLTAEQFGLSTAQNDPVNGRGYDRLSVYGADFNGALPFLKSTGLILDANYNVSAHGAGSGFNNIGHNWKYQSTDDQLGLKIAGITLKGGYQYVGPYYSAPGYWGKVGTWTNPSNVRGPVVSAKYSFGPKLTLNADFEQYKAAYGGVAGSPLQQGDFLHRYQVGLGYGLTSAYGIDLGYENVQYDLRNNSGTLARAGKPRESYVTIGIGHSFNPNASFKLLYQYITYDDKGTFFDPSSEFNNNGKTSGGVAVGQFSLKF